MFLGLAKIEPKSSEFFLNFLNSKSPNTGESTNLKLENESQNSGDYEF